MRRLSGFAIGLMALAAAGLVSGPVAAAKDRDRALVRKVERFHPGGGGLGVSLEDLDTEDASRLGLGEPRGALVTGVREGSAAAGAGVEKDDVIVRYNGLDVWGAAHLARMVRETPAGRTVALELVRGGASQRVSATIEERALARFDVGDHELDFFLEPPEPPAPPGAPEASEAPRPPRPRARAWPFRPPHGRPLVPDMRGLTDEIERATRWSLRDLRPGRLGIHYVELSDQLAAHYAVKGGILVSEVLDDSPAAKAGVKAGDVITRVAGREVADADDVHDALAGVEAGRQVTVTVQRAGKPTELTVTVGEGRARARRAPRARPTT